MKKISMEQTLNALTHFCTEGVLEECLPYGNGHINDTFLVKCRTGNEMIRYILQILNGTVFGEPLKVIENIERVTTALQNGNDDKRSVLSFIKTRREEVCHIDDEGIFWRMYDFIDNSVCLERPENAEDFYQCALAFGRFQYQLNEFPADVLYETIPDFHNTPKRYQDFLTAVKADVCGRAAGVQREIAFIKEHEDFYPVLYDHYAEGKLPLRVTHNDTKSNNVMLDVATHKALCVIDLDTVMPGFSVTDFGDAIRFGANTAAEDETDLTKVSIDLNLFEAYTKGFLTGCNGLLKESEIRLLPEGAKMMTLECGMRFLTDYLKGDTYFKTDYPEHNLVRCRTQLKLVADMEKRWDEMKRIVLNCKSS